MGKVFKTFARLAAASLALWALSPSFPPKTQGSTVAVDLRNWKTSTKGEGTNIIIGRDNSPLNTRLLSHFKQGWS